MNQNNQINNEEKNTSNQKVFMTIDNKVVEIFESDKNLVDLAARVKIGIPAPCYRDIEESKCCNSCVVEVNGEYDYACSTKPQEGMEVIVKREDLEIIRNERLKHYMNSDLTVAADEGCGCGCSCSSSASESSCC